MVFIDVEGPCSWPYLACDCSALDEMATEGVAEGVAEVVAMASYALWAATGKVFGPCPVSVHPCNYPSFICGGCRNSLRSCGCSSVPEIRLDGPVASVTEVVIDGVVFDEFSYRIDDYEWLVRLDGGSWPTGADPLDPDSFRVDYLLGIDPPAGAGLLTGVLACELAKAICNDESCRLPRNVRQLTRQGISAVFGEPGGKFGLHEVDAWVASANAPMFAGAVHSPDFPTIRRITWQAETSPSSP